MYYKIISYWHFLWSTHAGLNMDKAPCQHKINDVILKPTRFKQSGLCGLHLATGLAVGQSALPMQLVLTAI